jgi:tetratricopeptide (TPR) repeat protein
MKKIPYVLVITVFVIHCLIAFPINSYSQDAEKKKIIDVITSELDYWYNKDHDKWASCVVQSNEFQLTTAAPGFYFTVHTFDSLEAPTKQHFSTPVDPEVKRISKTDFKVSLKGNMAIADFTLRGDGFTGDQFSILEKHGKSWKILRQHTVIKSRYVVNDANIEVGINDQGYKLIQLKKFDEAIKVFTLNTELYPNAWNTWDSLADAYMKKGEKQIAIGYFKKSIQLNPQNEYAREMVESLEKD